MLFTRCPDCETTFRITAEALRKADGQVRCGRCARVFNAYNELRRRSRRRAPDSTAENEAAAHAGSAGPVRSVEPRSEDETDLVLGDISLANVIAELKASAAADEPDAADTAESGDAARDTPSDAARDTSSDAASRDTFGAVSRNTASGGAVSRDTASGGGAVADDAAARASPAAGAITAVETGPRKGDLTAGKRPAADSAQADEPAAQASTVTLPETNALLEKNGLLERKGVPEKKSLLEKHGLADESSPDKTGAPSWVILDEPRPKRLAARLWTLGSITAGVLLALQALHHFRSDIAVLAIVGPVIQEAYAALGTEIAPDWDLEQYEIVIDWDAAAQPDDDAAGNLKIAARIRNNGPRALPLPHVQVQLKDRWESTLGSRVFAPSEYLPDGTAGEQMMIAGQTAQAELDILDPGPQAYGFELDVCVDAQHGTLRCAADEVFR